MVVVDLSNIYKDLEKMIMKKTTKYNNMISSFSADFWLVKNSDLKLKELQSMINNQDSKLMQDIELLEELEFNLRQGKIMIVEVI